MFCPPDNPISFTHSVEALEKFESKGWVVARGKDPEDWRAEISENFQVTPELSGKFEDLAPIRNQIYILGGKREEVLNPIDALIKHLGPSVNGVSGCQDKIDTFIGEFLKN